MGFDGIARHVCTALLLLGMVAARGDTVTSAFTGTIVSSLDTANTAGHGAGPGVLDGLEARIEIAVEPSRSPPDTEPSPRVGRYVTRHEHASWLRITSVEVGGRALATPTFTGTVTRHDANQRILVTSSGDLEIFIDLDWEDRETGAYLDRALRIGIDGAARTDDALVPLVGAGSGVTGNGSFTLQRLAPGGVPEAYLGFDFRLTSVADDAPGPTGAPITP